MESLVIKAFISVALALFIAGWAVRRKSLNLSGGFAGFLVMSASIMASYRFGALLLVFFFTSSKLTKLGTEKKRKNDAEYKEGGQRDWMQVLVNSSIATALALGVAYLTGWNDICLNSEKAPLVTGLIGGILGHYACCNGDTWSSEIGVLSSSQPRLITTFKHVPHGTNGAVTIAGLLAAAAGGAVIGLTFVLVGLFTARCEGQLVSKQLLAFPIATFAGFFGSVVDSILGATVQYSGFCAVRKKVIGKPGPTVKKITGENILSNNGVNLVAIVLTALATSAVCLYVF
ncbi:hypothetical protein KI387_035120 [Taxus chinensis]|uniref:Transmembrane protein 19 n=1 Tax=Taxus chinensis TaxID=29808 RepID=A0AA38FMV0_TAXCH|nr:hypothetical protein KI387_035120 [Taxus chinensis]